MVMRIGGMSSGLDIDAMVSDLMKAERMPLDKLKQKQQSMTWKSDAYREINTKLASFRDLANSMRFSANWKTTKVTTSDPNVVTVSSSDSAAVQTRSILVQQLAKGAVLTSTNPVSSNSLVAGSALSSSTTITSGANDQFNVTLNGSTKTITLTASGSPYTEVQLKNEVQKQLDAAFGAGQITASLDASNQLELKPNGTAGNLPQLIVDRTGSNTGLSNLGFSAKQSFKINVDVPLNQAGNPLATPISAPSGAKFTVNGVEISYQATDTLQSIMQRVNSSTAGVNMSYDSITDKVTFTSKATGVASKVELADVTGNFISAMGLTTLSAAGQDAKVTFDGSATPTYYSSNSFTNNGVTYTLLNTSASAVTVASTKDTDAIFNKIKDFVANYNNTLTLVNKKLTEVKYRDFLPLTDEQKDAMSESDIKNWEEKAKSGLLQRDDILKSASTNFRQMINAKINTSSTFDSLFKIGITTTSFSGNASTYNSVTANTIVLDENKLKAAIAQDPDGVISLFSRQSGLTNPTINDDGIAQSMYKEATSLIDRLVDRAGGTTTANDDITTTVGLQIHNLDLDIEDMESRLLKKEDYYYHRFTLMEQAIQKGQAQLSWLSSLR
ncbi:flagellar filament capping protein FliD [Paenibacillus chartarius]|uniref:Flagellar hook-associated protein 2 n=1 Tax=Paenibacillus chartarius TaxID=747481 RepID=A0ABV6DJV3_9BACL